MLFFIRAVELIAHPLFTLELLPSKGGLPLSPHYSYYYYQDGVCGSGSIVENNNTKTRSRINNIFSPSE
jgi:hypothetical protein